MSTERNTHFHEFAELHYLELGHLFSKMYAAWAMGEEAQARAIVYEIKTLIAQRAYDLVYHALEDASNGEHAFDAEIVFKQVTDLTEWPTRPTPSPEQVSE